MQRGHLPCIAMEPIYPEQHDGAARDHRPMSLWLFANGG